jgi:hypothetical protein
LLHERIALFGTQTLKQLQLIGTGKGGLGVAALTGTQPAGGHAEQDSHQT